MLHGEGDDFVLFGDRQACFQVYIDLYHLDPEKRRIARAREVMDYQISTPETDYLWWSDGLFMVMPMMSEMAKLTGDEKYLERLHDYFSYSKDLMFDAGSGLFFRDAKYVYPKHKSANGKKDFWARGNGWVFAALPMVLDDLPADHPHRTGRSATSSRSEKRRFRVRWWMPDRRPISEWEPSCSRQRK